MNRGRIAFLALLIFGMQAAGLEVACAQTPAEGETRATAVDPAGTWMWNYEFNGNTAEFKVRLKWKDEELTGEYTAFDRTTDIEQVKFDKNQLSFVTKREYEGRQFTVHFDGKVKPDDIAGTVKVDFGGDGPREFDWNAQRVVDVDDVLGAWHLRVVSPNGVIEPRLTITAEGDELRGTSATEAFGELEAKNVQLKDNTLTWEIVVENNGNEFRVKYSGKPRGNTIEGSNEFSVGGNTGTMKFTGKRTPPEEKQKGRSANEDGAATDRSPADDSADDSAAGESGAKTE